MSAEASTSFHSLQARTQEEMTRSAGERQREPPGSPSLPQRGPHAGTSKFMPTATAACVGWTLACVLMTDLVWDGETSLDDLRDFVQWPREGQLWTSRRKGTPHSWTNEGERWWGGISTSEDSGSTLGFDTSQLGHRE